MILSNLTPFIQPLKPVNVMSIFSLWSFNFFWKLNIILHCVVPENIHTPPMEGFSNWTPHPSGNFLLVSYFHSKNLAFEIPLPHGISIILPWGGYEYFLELHIPDTYIKEQLFRSANCDIHVRHIKTSLTGLSLRAITLNTCYSWLYLIFPWCHRWNCLLLKKFNHKETSSPLVWTTRVYVTQNLKGSLDSI